MYQILKFIARIAIRIFCRRIIINKPESLQFKGPLLLACNHPNSFLDSVIIDTLFEQPVWSLARGDVFKKPFYIKILTALRILPVYRTSEGVENLSENYRTFEACIEIFRKNGIVTIFSEGKCINEWHLRPLKKGTARLAFKTWSEGIPLQVLPVGINYSSFRKFGKNIFLNFGNVIEPADFNLQEADGAQHAAFNYRLEEELSTLVMEIDKDDREKKERQLKVHQPLFKKIILFLPALLGWILHAPLYLPVKNFTWKRTYLNDHFDSVMTAILIFAYPLYLLMFVILAWLLTGSLYSFLLILFIPITAWSYVQIKPQLDK